VNAPAPAESWDVIVLGGGLAGLCCALQLRQANPQSRMLVLDRRRGDSPAGVHTVGESTVEIAAHYFSEVLGLGEHLRTQQLRKFGFRFFNLDGREDIDGVQEIGVSRYLNVTSFQIDRGLFENYLRERARALGVEVREGCTVGEIAMASGAHRGAPAHSVHCQSPQGPQDLQARWVIDASGRSGVLKRQLGLAQPSPHDAHAVWFRMPCRIDIEAWSSDPEWLGRCEHAQRWLSTNHLVGQGYWVWLIPLASGYHSIGIVADPALHPPGQFSHYAGALAWLEVHQPRLARALRECGQQPGDYVAMRQFAHGCREVFSGDRWAITGDAGVFLDPFYSPGSDFIAIANTYIADLVTRDLHGEPWAPFVGLYGQLFRSFYESTLQLYVGQYSLFGHPQALATKVIWDYTYYWGVLCQLFFQGRLTDVPALGRSREPLGRARALNEAMQPWLRRWAATVPADNRAVLLDQAGLPWFDALNRSLVDTLDDAGFRARILASLARMQELAAEIVGRALAQLPGCRDWPETRALLQAAGREATPGGTLLAYPQSPSSAARPPHAPTPASRRHA
jgi:flavin-dependent dehydrogenase